MGARPTGDFDPQIAELIRFKVKRLIGNYGFTRSDEEDLRQELAMHVVAGMKTYDATRSSPHTYADRIVTSKIADIIDHSTAQKRDRRRQRPLDAVPEPASPPERDPLRGSDTKLDVQAAMANLPDDLRAIATLFMNSSEAEVIRKTGMGRQRVRGLRRRLARFFAAMGLDPNSSA
jgi:DNA-directed RNA polymerase specialized sigma24 family protein